MRETLNFRYLRKTKTHSRCIRICHQESSKGNLRGRKPSVSWPYHLSSPIQKGLLVSSPFCREGRLRGRVVRLVGQDHKAKLEWS